jgi:hypothetical protein
MGCDKSFRPMGRAARQGPDGQDAQEPATSQVRAARKEIGARAGLADAQRNRDRSEGRTRVRGV